MATRLGLASAPAIAEAMAVARDLCLVEETGAALHFRPVTTARALDLIREAKARGLPRSEEHTSELQSLIRISYSVFRLKKKSLTQPTTFNHTLLLMTKNT